MARSIYWLIALRLFAALRPTFFAFAVLSIAGLCLSDKAQLPLWLRLFSSLFAAPTFFFAKLYLGDWDHKYRARAAGAKLPPLVPYKWPGGIDLIVAMIKAGTERYLGEGFYSFIARNSVQAAHLYILFENRIITSEPAHIKSILATDFESFEKGDIPKELLDSVLGTGVFNADGDVWRFHRSMSRPFFSRDRISHFEIFNRHVDDALEQAKRRLREGYALDFQDMVSRFTLDSAAEFLFGHDVKSLSAGLPYPSIPGAPVKSSESHHPANVFTRAFTQVQSEAAMRVRYGPFWPFFELSGDRTRKHMEVIDAFVEPIISNALDQAKAEKSQGADAAVDEGDSNAGTLLGHLVRMTDDRKLIKDEILNIAIAGRDTTACLLTFATYMLSQNPHVMDRLYDEIQSLLPDGQRPTFDDIKNMRYMRAVLNETLRLYPSVPFNMRYATRDVVWQPPNGNGDPLFVPKDTACVFTPFLMHRREDLWGPEALVFDPDRFLDERLHKYLVPNPFIFSAFSAGPRICLGQQFAYNEASFMLTRLVQEFSKIELALDAGPQNMKPPPEWAAGPGRKAVEKINIRSHFTLYAVGGLWVRMEERKRDV
ncbi:cytochrome P450 [Peniophora sp. CONT]|nr:cytochrome P450 [Peniophora sp. CONT]